MEQSKKQKTRVVLAICCVSSVLMCYSMLTPILAEISRSFPGARPAQVQMVYTLVALVSLPSMLLAGGATRFLSKRKLASVGMGLMLLGGLLPLVLHSRLWMLYLSSALVGIGMGAVNVLSGAMISDHFSGLEKGKIMGLQSAALSLGAAVLSVLGGKIADFSAWPWAFSTYFLGIPMLFTFLHFMPDGGTCARQPPARLIFNRRLTWLAVLGLLWNVFITGFQTNISLFIEEAGFGGVALSGVVSAIFMLIGLPAGFALGLYMRAFRRWSGAVALLCAASGMFFVAFAGGVEAVLIGTFLMGASFSIYPPSAMTFVTSMVPPESAAVGLALHNGLCCLGKFISPYVLGVLSTWTDGSFRGTFLIGGGGLALLGVLYLLTNPVKATDLAPERA